MVFRTYQLTPHGLETWKKHFANQRDRRCDVFEGIWRRTQDQKNALESGWASPEDARRRMIHFCYRFGLDRQENLAITGAYLWVNLSFPSQEMAGYLDMVSDSQRQGGWKVECSAGGIEKCVLEGMEFAVQRHGRCHPVDIRDGRRFPEGYETVSFTFSYGKMPLAQSYLEMPWGVLRSGIRAKDPHEEPQIASSLEEVREFFPAHIETGCGPSTECGVPPLCELHDLFRVTDHNTGRFILGAKGGDTLLRDVLATPGIFFNRVGSFFLSLVEAKVTPFYGKLKQMIDAGLVFEPIFTNNFDRLLASVGIREKYLRRYDETHIIPNVKFDPRAKSLMVVGVHADRRKIEAAARRAGLKIIHIDPEIYSVGDTLRYYPIEGTRSEDILIRSSASDAFSGFDMGGADEGGRAAGRHQARRRQREEA